MIELDLVKYVKKVTICSSCYLGCASQEDIAACDGVYSGDVPEPREYRDPKDEELVAGMLYHSFSAVFAISPQRFLFFVLF